MSNLGRRVAGGVAWLTLGRLAAAALQLVAFAIIASDLGPSAMGVFTLALGLVGILQIGTDFGFQGVVTREVAQDRTREPSLIPNLLYIRVVGGVASYVVVAIVALVALPGSQRVAVLVAGGVLLVAALEALATGLQVRVRTGPAALGSLLGAVAFLVATVVLERADAGVAAYLAAKVATTLIAVGLPAVAGVTSGALVWRPQVGTWVQLARMAVPIGLAFAMNYIYYRVDLVLLAALRPIEDVGQYGVAYRFIDALMMLPSFVMYVLRPVISSSFTEGIDILRRRYDRCLYVLFLTAVPLGVGGAMTAWRLLPVIPGFEDYAGAGVALSILLPAFSIILVAHLVQSALVSAHLQRRLLVISAVGLALNLIATVVLIVLFAYIGAAVATLLTELVVAALSAEILRRRVGLPIVPAGTARIVLLTAFVAIVLGVSYSLPPIAQASLGLVAFALGVPLLGALTPDDLRALGLRAPRLWPPALVPRAVRR